MAKIDKTKVVAEEGTPAAETLQTKSAVMSGILQAINAMDHEQMMQWFHGSQEIAAMIGNGQANYNASTIQMKPSAAVGAMKEDFAKLFDGEALTEELRNKFETLFENAVDVRVALIREELEEAVVKQVEERTASVKEEMVDKVDQYVTYAAEQWVEKNDVAIESTLKVERAERLFSGLSKLMAECAITLPEDQVDAVEELTKQVEDLRASLNEQTEETIAYKEQLEAVTALRVFDEVSEGLALTEVEKFKKLVEDVEVTSDVADLKKKLSIIREAHFPKEGARPAGKEGLTEEAEHAPAGSEPDKAVPTSRYADYLSRASIRRYGAL